MASYKALLTADWQLCNALPYAQPIDGGVTDRLHDQIQVVQQIKQIAKAECVDGIWVLGDIYEKRLLDAITLLWGVDLVHELAEVARVFLLPGNHDAHSNTSGRFLLEMFGAIRNKRIMYLGGSEVVRVGKGLKIDVYPLPWCPTAQAATRIKAMAEAQQGGADWNVLMLHQSINGCRDGGWVCDDGLDATEVCEGWDKVYAGHFHDYQTFGCCGEYVSAPMQHHFGDAGSTARGVSVVEFSKGEVREQQHAIKAPRFHVCEWHKGEPRIHCEHKGKWNEGDYVRLDVEATHAEWKAMLPEVIEVVESLREQGFNALDPKHVPLLQHEERLPVGDKVTDEEVLTKYLDLANAEGLDRELLMQIGLSVLQEVSND